MIPEWNGQAIQTRLLTLSGRRDELRERLADLDDEITSRTNTLRCHDSARIIGQWLTDQTRSDVQAIFGGIGTAALRAVFGPAARFAIDFTETPAGKRQAILLAEADGVVGDPVRKSGNSVSAVLSTVLRRAMILLHPRLRNVLIADEPLYGIDSGRLSDMAQIDREMVDDHGLQIIVITHEGEECYRELADVILDVEKQDGESRIEITDNRKIEIV